MSNTTIDNFVNTGNDLKLENCEYIPNSLIKCGEILCKDFKEPIFVCSICLENAGSFNSAYTTSDASVFWWHIQQQHMTNDCETIEDIAAEIQSFATNNIETDVSHDKKHLKIRQIEDQSEHKTDETQLKLLDEFHAQSDVNEVTEIDLYNNKEVQVREEISSSHVNAVIIREDITPNQLEEAQASPNVHKEREKDDNQNIHGIDGERSLITYLKHNDLIEISDDEESEDNGEYLQNSSLIIQARTGTFEENILSPPNPVNAIPTPELSPCESLTNQQRCTNLSCFQWNNDFAAYNMSTNKPQHCPKERAKTFRAFQCRICGTRTVSEKKMKIHFERIHKTLLHKLRFHEYSSEFYHQIQESDQNKQQDLMRFYNKSDAQINLFHCKTCKAKTKTIQSMERHQQLYHSSDTNLWIQCDICRKRIHTNKFQMHMQNHASTGFTCNYCGAVYKQKQYLNIHIRKYHAARYLNSSEMHPQHFNNYLNQPVLYPK